MQFMHSPGAKKCPLCRIRVVQVNWNHGDDFFVLGSGVDDDGPFIREDEIIRGGMGEVEQERRRELRRLRNLEDYGMEPVPNYMALILVSRDDIPEIGIILGEAILIVMLLLLLWWFWWLLSIFGEKEP